MLVKTFGAAVQGIDAITVTIEVAARPGASFSLVGMADTAVKESYQRVLSATTQAGFQWPRRNMVVNLSPADVRKEGAAYDLPIAVAILTACGLITPVIPLESMMIMGELSLDGSVLPIRGALPMAILARSLGFKALIVPKANEAEAAVVNNLDVYGVSTLREVIDFVAGEIELKPVIIDTRAEFARDADCFDCDFDEVKGQENVKRALEVACAGGHNILMVGPPGAGKSMMAKRVPTIMPPLTLAEALETTKIHSVAGKLRSGSRLLTRRPYRAPHHTISPVALVGGGSNPCPGEISLAHNGVLFLDELPEFTRQVLEVMRQPLEDRHISISRAKYALDYPAGFMLVASMNPCPCGYYNHPTKECICPPGVVAKYLNRISGPLLDRIDLQVEIFPVAFEELSSYRKGESSAAIKSRVVKAREIQAARFRNVPGVHCNAQMTARLLQEHAALDEEAMNTVKEAMVKFDMSARAYDRILKVARTVADLERALDPTLSPAQAASMPIERRHVCEALAYRNLDRASWGTAKQSLPF